MQHSCGPGPLPECRVPVICTGFPPLALVMLRVTIVAVETAVIITYSACVSVAFAIQHAKRMRRIILSLVARLALPNFLTFLHKR